MEKIINLSNGLRVVYEQVSNTPRCAVNFFINSGVVDERNAGETSLITKLLLQGTEKLSAKELAEKIDLYAIEFITDVKQDYIKIKTVFLNEDIEIAFDLMSDVILNSTFENFDKEVNKLKGEIQSDLDSARLKALDNLIKTLYENHPYGNSHTKVLEAIDKIKKEDVKELYFNNLFAQNCVLSVVGDISEEKLVELLEKYFAAIPVGEAKIKDIKTFKATNINSSREEFACNDLYIKLGLGIIEELINITNKIDASVILSSKYLTKEIV